jgi:hypothetical protein
MTPPPDPPFDSFFISISVPLAYEASLFKETAIVSVQEDSIDISSLDKK